MTATPSPAPAGPSVPLTPVVPLTSPTPASPGSGRASATSGSPEASADLGLLSLLDATERDRYRQFLREQPRALYLTAHALAREVIAAQYGVRPAALRFAAVCKHCTGAHGKPRLVDPPFPLELSSRTPTSGSPSPSPSAPTSAWTSNASATTARTCPAPCCPPPNSAPSVRPEGPRTPRSSATGAARKPSSRPPATDCWSTRRH
ncbi:hypothetical protein O1L55_08100 [Streptomyces albulus]|nr:hypothetical protein [Streptomyces noursei]